MSSQSFMNTPTPPSDPSPGRPVLDAFTVAVVLYLSPFTHRDWTRLGPREVARFVTRVTADPRCRVPEMTTLVIAAETTGRLGAAEKLAAARRYAPRVLAALAH